MALIPLFEAKTYLRVDSSDEDVLVRGGGKVDPGAVESH